MSSHHMSEGVMTSHHMSEGYDQKNSEVNSKNANSG